MIEIRSYRSVFELERRIYRVDRVRLNPAGIPVRGVVYLLALLASALVLARIPISSELLGILPWYLRYLLLPLAMAGLLTLVRVEGRPFHLAARALARHALGPSRLAAFRACAAPGRRWHPADLLMFPDGSESCLRRMSYTGPGAVWVAPAHERTDGRTSVVARWTRRPQLIVSEIPGVHRPVRAQVIALDSGARLRVG